jgi:hypothetical protein
MLSMRVPRRLDSARLRHRVFEKYEKYVIFGERPGEPSLWWISSGETLFEGADMFYRKRQLEHI